MAAGDVSVGITTPKGFRCAKFDGVDDYVDCGNDVSLNVSGGTKEFSLSAWIKASVLTTTQRIVSNKGADGTFGYGFGLTSKKLRMTIFGVKDYDTTSDVVTSENVWYQIVVVFDSLNASFYSDGSFIETVVGGVQSQQGSTTTIGRAGLLSTEYFNGTIDEVRIYNRALSAAEILKLYQRRSDITKGLVGHWKLDEAEGETTAVDSSGFGNNGTVTGALFGNYESDLAAAIKAQRGAATDSFFLCDIGNGNQVLHTQITEA